MGSSGAAAAATHGRNAQQPSRGGGSDTPPPPLLRGPLLAVALVAAFAALALVPSLQGPEVVVGPPQRTHLQTERTGPLDEPGFRRETLTFACSGDACEAWLYTPKGLPAGARAPVVLMAHGMGGQKEFGLHSFASEFADAGLAVFVFDYRGWGGSSGEPRHWLSARRHMDDWRAAIRHVRASLSEAVDTARLALWGTSFAGGHVLVVAAEPEFAPHITAVVTQVPNLDAVASTKVSIKQRGISKSLRMLLAGLTDLARSALGQPPIYLPLAGPPGSMAFMQMSPEELQRYLAAKPSQPQGGWRNMARALYAAEHALAKTSPIKHVGRITAPVLYCGAARDTLCPMAVVERAVAATPRAELHAVDCDHFQLFTPQHLANLKHRQREFLLQHLGTPKAATTPGASQEHAGSHAHGGS